MKKILAFILVLALVCTFAVSFAGCGKDADGDKKETKSSGIVGTWTADFPIGKALEKSLSADAISDPSEAKMIADALKDINFDDYKSTALLVLEKNGEFSMEIPKDELTKTVKSFVTKFGNGFVNAFEASLKETGLTLEGALNMTKDQFVSALLEQFNPEDIEKELGDLSESGKYTFKDNKLTLIDKDNEKAEFEIELTDDKLVLVSVDGESDSDEYAVLLPWTFTRTK